MGDVERDVTLWPTAENYPRFVAACDDEVPATFEEFEALAAERMADAESRGFHIEKIAFDPDRMALWCRAHFGRVDAVSRAAYAGFLALSD